FVVLKRMVFVSAALSEISGVGVAFAFWLGAVLGIDPHAHGRVPLLLEPTWFSLLFACMAAALFSLRPGHRKLAAETIVGLGYIVASALVLAILNSPRIAQEAHAVGDILFGNAVTVPRTQIYALAAAGAVAVIAHGLFFKELLFVSYDPETATVQGVGVLRYEVLLNFIIAVVISVATRAVGALPVFAFTVVPAAAALMVTENIRATMPAWPSRKAPRRTQVRTRNRCAASWRRRSGKTPPRKPRSSRGRAPKVPRRPPARPEEPLPRCRSSAAGSRSIQTSARSWMPK